MLQSIVLIVHVAVALLIVGLVLLQRGKGAEAGTGFGAGASGTVFGARGSANFLSRTTAVLATLFFATSLALAYLAGERPPPASLLEQTATQPSPGPGAGPTPQRGTELPELPGLQGEPSEPQGGSPGVTDPGEGASRN